MIFSGRLGLRKFFTLADYLVSPKATLSSPNYKHCHEKEDGLILEANPQALLRQQQSRGYNMCCHEARPK